MSQGLYKWNDTKWQTANDTNNSNLATRKQFPGYTLGNDGKYYKDEVFGNGITNGEATYGANGSTVANYGSGLNGTQLDKVSSPTQSILSQYLGFGNKVSNGVTYNPYSDGLYRSASGTTLTPEALNSNVRYTEMKQDPNTGEWSGGFEPGNGVGISNTGNGTGFGWNTETLGAAAGALQGLSALANAYTGMQNLDMAKKKFAFEKDATNANYINNAKSYNTNLQNAHDVGLALGGSAMSADQIAASNAYTNSRKVSENKIG